MLVVPHTLVNSDRPLLRHFDFSTRWHTIRHHAMEEERHNLNILYSTSKYVPGWFGTISILFSFVNPLNFNNGLVKIYVIPRRIGVEGVWRRVRKVKNKSRSSYFVRTLIIIIPFPMSTSLFFALYFMGGALFMAFYFIFFLHIRFNIRSRLPQLWGCAGLKVRAFLSSNKTYFHGSYLLAVYSNSYYH